MKQHWWKILAVLILFYTFFVGLLVPLKPGVIAVSPDSAKSGEEVRLEIQGYNTNFLKGSKDIRAWLKIGEDRSIPSNNILVKGDELMYAFFQLPNFLPVEAPVTEVSLIIDNPIDGAFVLPSAIFASQDQVNANQGKLLWRTGNINGLHELDQMTYPFRNILQESIRNMYFHVPLWFGMIIILLGAVYCSARYLSSGNRLHDMQAVALTQVGVVFGLLGLLTGAIWAKYTWNAWWSFDVKQNMSAIAVLIYMAYFVLRSSFEDIEKQSRLGAVYNIFAFAALIPLLFIIPRLTDSLHPGNGGNPGFGGEDLDNTMRMVFYPAIIGWTLLGVWMAQLKLRTEQLQERLSWDDA
ncbi:MAG: cytochrome c biogenesis protein CcsA [Bacteroidota bacterium]